MLVMECYFNSIVINRYSGNDSRSNEKIAKQQQEQKKKNSLQKKDVCLVFVFVRVLQ